MLLKWFRRLFGYCDMCHRYFAYPKRRRQNTQYLEEEKNYVVVCLDCFKFIEDGWQGLWDEYNSGRI